MDRDLIKNKVVIYYWVIKNTSGLWWVYLVIYLSSERCNFMWYLLIYYINRYGMLSNKEKNIDILFLKRKDIPFIAINNLWVPRTLNGYIKK
jgi:hypothetical protein